MTKRSGNAKDKSQSDRVKSPEKTYNAGEEGTTSHRKRKLMPPAKPSRLGEKAIIEAIEKVMAQRSSH